MIALSGGAGRAYAGHQEAAVLGAWHIAYNDTVPLGGQRFGQGSAVVDISNDFWRMMPITRLVLRAGTKAWIWSDVKVSINALVEFEVYGDPEITDWRE